MVLRMFYSGSREVLRMFYSGSRDVLRMFYSGSLKVFLGGLINTLRMEITFYLEFVCYNFLIELSQNVSVRLNSTA